MSSKKFYRLILSKGVPLFMLLYGGYYAFYFRVVKKMNDTFILLFVLVFFSLIVIVECIIAFCRTIRVLKGVNKRYFRVIRFRLLMLPYLPAFLGTFFYGALRIVEYGILYKREFIISLGTTLLINFIFSAIYNCTINTFEYIQYDSCQEEH